MIRRIKALAGTTPGEIVDGIVSHLKALDDVEELEGQRDPSLDLLLKHAMHSASPGAPNAGRIWQQLSRRVVGPFGGLAVEGPASGGGGSERVPFNLESRPFEAHVGHRAGSEAGGDALCSGFVRMCDVSLSAR